MKQERFFIISYITFIIGGCLTVVFWIPGASTNGMGGIVVAAFIGGKKIVGIERALNQR